MTKGNSTKHFVIMLVFLAFITVPFLDLVLDLDRTHITENRKLAAFPKAPDNASSFFAWPQQFNLFYKDNFGLRNFFLVSYNMIMAQFPGTIPGDLVLVGKDGWFFGKETDYYRHLKKYSDVELRNIRDNLLWRQQRLARHGITYFYVIVPRKATLFPQYLPDNLNVVRETSQVEQIVNYLKEDGRVNILDLRFAFDESELSDVFYPGDLHWSDLGALRASNMMVDYLQGEYPDLSAISENDVTRIRHVEPGIEWVEFLGLQGLYEYDRLNISVSKPQFRVKQEMPLRKFEKGLQIFENDSADPIGILVYTDSFGDKLKKFLPHIFGNTVFCRNSFTVRRSLTSEVRIACTLLFEGNIIRDVLLDEAEVDDFVFEKSGRNITQIVPENISQVSFSLATSIHPQQDYLVHIFVGDTLVATEIAEPKEKRIRLNLPKDSIASEKELRLESDYPNMPKSLFQGHEIPFSFSLTCFGAKNLRVRLNINDTRQIIKEGYTLYHLNLNGSITEKLEFPYSSVAFSNDLISALDNLHQKDGYFLLLARGENQNHLTKELTDKLAEFGSEAMSDIEKAHIHVMFYDLTGRSLILEKFTRDRIDLSSSFLRNKAELILTDLDMQE